MEWPLSSLPRKAARRPATGLRPTHHVVFHASATLSTHHQAVERLRGETKGKGHFSLANTG